MSLKVWVLSVASLPTIFIERKKPEITQSSMKPVRGLAASQCFAAGPVSTAAGMASGVVTLRFQLPQQKGKLIGIHLPPNTKVAGGKQVCLGTETSVLPKSRQ